MYKNISSPWHALEAFKNDMRQKYGAQFKGSMLTDNELEIMTTLRANLALQSETFIKKPAANGRIS